MKRFLAIALVAFLAASALLYLVSTRARDHAQTSIGRDVVARAQLLALSFDRTIQARLGEVFTFSALPSLRGFAASDESTRPARIAAAQFELRGIVSADPSILAASIVDVKGQVVLATDESMNADWSNRIFVREGMLGHPHASPTMREFNSVSQFYSAPILDNFGNVAGILVVRVVGQEIWDALFAASNTLVIDENGVRLADSMTPSQPFTAINPLANEVIIQVNRNKLYGADISQIRVAPFPELAAQLKTRRATQTILRDASGVTYLAAIQPLESSPWSVVVLARDDPFGFAATGYWEAFGWGAFGALLITALGYFALK